MAWKNLVVQAEHVLGSWQLETSGYELDVVLVRIRARANPNC